MVERKKVGMFEKDWLTGLKVKNAITGEESIIPGGGLFVAIGHKPNTQLFTGVLDTDEFIKEIKKAIYAINPLFCGLTGQVEPQMRQASDILVDGTQSAAKTCNGISIGFGFTMKQMQLGGVGPKTAPATMTCTP